MLILPNTIVTSCITGERIIATQVHDKFIVGKLEGFKRYPPSHILKAYDGTKILSKKNIL